MEGELNNITTENEGLGPRLSKGLGGTQQNKKNPHPGDGKGCGGGTETAPVEGE